MELTNLSKYARSVSALYQAALEMDMKRALERLEKDEQWELLGLVIITAPEVPARRAALILVDHECYSDLVLPACFRRQVRKTEVIITDPMRTKRIFRDIDAEDDEGGVPEHIAQEAEDIADAADASRMAALSRAAAVDRDPLREFIVDAISKKIATSEDAAEALMVIAKAGAFEDARRMAALRLANHELTIRRLAREGRAADMIVVAENSGLDSVRTNMARALGPVLGAMRAQKDWDSLRWAGEHHPDPKAREAIADVLRGEAQ